MAIPQLSSVNEIVWLTLARSKDDYLKIISKAVRRSLDIYLKAIKGEEGSQVEESQTLVKIGAIAKSATETVPTIRYWTKEGLLKVAEFTKSNYALYDQHTTLATIEKIQQLKKQRYTLSEIKEKLG